MNKRMKVLLAWFRGMSFERVSRVESESEGCTFGVWLYRLKEPSGFSVILRNSLGIEESDGAIGVLSAMAEREREKET